MSKKCLVSLVIRGIQTKTTLRFHLFSVRLAKVSQANDHLRWWGCGKRGILVHCWKECKLVQPLWEPVWRFLRKVSLYPSILWQIREEQWSAWSLSLCSVAGEEGTIQKSEIVQSHLGHREIGRNRKLSILRGGNISPPWLLFCSEAPLLF